jgi:hypothetical protein
VLQLHSSWHQLFVFACCCCCWLQLPLGPDHRGTLQQGQLRGGGWRHGTRCVAGRMQ